MIPQRASLAVLPRIIRIYKLLAYMLVGIGVISALVNISPLFSARGIIGFNQLPTLLAVIFGPIVTWGLAGLGMFTFAVVLDLLLALEENSRLVATYIRFQAKRSSETLEN